MGHSRIDIHQPNFTFLGCEHHREGLFRPPNLLRDRPAQKLPLRRNRIFHGLFYVCPIQHVHEAADHVDILNLLKPERVSHLAFESVFRIQLRPELALSK